MSVRGRCLADAIMFILISVSRYSGCDSSAVSTQIEKANVLEDDGKNLDSSITHSGECVDMLRKVSVVE